MLDIWNKADLGSSFGRARGRNAGFSIPELILVVLAILVISVIAMPKLASISKSQRIGSDARDLASNLGLAKLEAASAFTRSRVYVDISNKSFHVEVWNKTSSAWVTQPGTQNLQPGVSAAYYPLTTPPTGTQASIGQAATCRDNSGNTISGTACIVFNSRGYPIDPTTGALDGTGAFYITDGSSTYGITVSVLGLVQTWRSAASTASWAIV